MKAFIVACVAMVVIAIGGAMLLELYQAPVTHAFTTTGVRI